MNQKLVNLILDRKKRKFGVDLDETAWDFIHPFLLFLKETKGIEVKYEDIKSYNFWENGIGRNREEAVGLVGEFCSSPVFVDSIRPLAGAEEAISSLAREGKVYFLTSRQVEMREKTEFAVGKFFGGSGEVYYSGDFHKQGKTKAELCRELAISEFYEDNLQYALECAKYITRVFLFDRPWNRAETNGKITRVKSWKEAMERR